MGGRATAASLGNTDVIGAAVGLPSGSRSKPSKRLATCRSLAHERVRNALHSTGRRMNRPDESGHLSSLVCKVIPVAFIRNTWYTILQWSCDLHLRAWES